MTLKLVDQPSGPGPFSVLLLGVVMAIAGSSKAGAQIAPKGALASGPDSPDHPCRLNLPKNCSIPELEKQLAFDKADAMQVFLTSDEIGKRGSGADAEAVAKAVIREASRGPNVMNPGAPDYYDHIVRVLAQLAAKPGAPDVGVEIMHAFEDVYKQKHDRLVNADANAQPYMAQHWEDGPQFFRLAQALGDLPATAATAREMGAFLNATADDGPSKAREEIVSITQRPEYQQFRQTAPRKQRKQLLTNR